MRMLFVRHSQDDPKYRGAWSSLGLIKEGLNQSKLLSKYFKKKYLPIDKIISSDLNRIIETTNIIKKEIFSPIDYNKLWREINNGDLARILNTMAEIKFPNIYFNTLKLNKKTQKEKVL